MQNIHNNMHLPCQSQYPRSQEQLVVQFASLKSARILEKKSEKERIPNTNSLALCSRNNKDASLRCSFSKFSLAIRASLRSQSFFASNLDVIFEYEKEKKKKQKFNKG